MKRALGSLAAFAAFGALVTLSPSARADNVDACVDGADRAQQLRDQGKLLQAREALIACANASCPTAIAKQCAKWLQDVEAEVPGVSLRVRSPQGTDVVDVVVTVDGVARPNALDGRPIALDPGPHRFTFKRGNATAESSVVVRGGERNRLVDVTLVAPEAPEPPPVVIATPPPPPEHTTFHFPWTTGVFLGVAAASFAGTVALVAIASSDSSSLRTSCAPSCTVSDVDAARTKLVVANVTLGVGIVSIALAAVFVIVANVGHHEKRAALVPTSFAF